jgi:hypothetical protein
MKFHKIIIWVCPSASAVCIYFEVIEKKCLLALPRKPGSPPGEQIFPLKKYFQSNKKFPYQIADG